MPLTKTEKDTSIQMNLTELTTLIYGGSQGEVYSVRDKLFSNVEVPQITWDNEPVKLEMTYEVTQKS